MSEETKPEEKKNGKDEKETPKDNLSVTQHTAVINGQEISYTVTCGTIVLKEEAEKEGKAEGEKAKASIFFVAYTVDGVENVAQRPLTFSFNGGPGSSSVWLHMGTLGPRRVQMGDETGNLPRPPYQLVDNEFSLLDQSDLVFIDPVNTGYSRPAPGEPVEEFHHFKRDLESVGEFIRLYTSRYQRWPSPKFLIGESYGTTRAAGLSGYLQQRYGLYLNGIMLISSILNFQTADFHPGNDLPYILFLPTYTATAWYHGQLAADLQADLPATLREVEQFALGEYALGLLRGAELPAAEQTALAEKLARYTGLSVDYVQQTNLRINIHRYCKELLREKRQTVGRLDSRFTGVNRDAAGEHVDFDPSYAVILGPYTAVFNDYIRRELQYENDLPYEILNFRVNETWKYDQFVNQYVDVADTLRGAIATNPHLQVFIANGYYDLATPYFATRYTVNHLQLEPELQANIRQSFYEAGHMMYVHSPSLAKLKDDLAAFVASVVA